MRPPTILSTIDRRVLVSYRVDPEMARRCLPEPIRPALHAGVAVAGICLIRFTALRPSPAPRIVGITTENIAHRFAVEWDGPAGVETGVFVPRRDTSSRLAQLLGGRLFPGPMAHGRFHVDEGDDAIHIRYRSDDGDVSVDVGARRTDRWPQHSVFDTLVAASEFFRRDSVGYSPSARRGPCDAVELQTTTWNAAPLDIDRVHSSWFDDESRFARGTIEFDSALLMRRIPARWIPREPRPSAEAADAR